MAFNVETVGTLGSGANRSATEGALAAWEVANDSEGGEQRAVLITDITDNVTFSGWDSGGIIEIVSDVEGAQRTITAPSGGDHVLKFSDANITTVKIEDVICDGKSHQATSQSGIYVHTGVTELTLNRCRTNDCEEHGLHVGSSALLETLTANNCIFNDNDVHGVLLQYVATESTNTFTNCISFGNGADGWNSTNNGNIIRVFGNCIGMDNDSSDFETQASTTTTLDSCVSSDTSAEDSGTDTNCAVSKTTYADYFLDHTAGNFTRTQNDSDAFGIAGNASLTPARDYYFIERANDTIGPFDLILGRQTHRISKLFNGTDGFVDVGDISASIASIKGISFWCRPSVVESHTDSLLSLNSSDTITLVNDQVTTAGFSGATVTRYVDGVAGSTLVANVWQHVFVDSDTGFSASNLHIGRAGSVYFGGYLRDVRLYTTTVSAGDIASLADPDKTCSTALETAGHWKLESSHPVRAYDSSGNANHGGMAAADVTNDLESPVPFSFANEVGYSSSLFFDGSAVYPAVTDHLTFPAAIKTTMSLTNDWSLHFDYVAGATTGILFGSQNDASTDRFALGNGTRCSVEDSTGQINASVSGSTVSGTRYRWAVTWEASGRNLKIWRNGVANTSTLDANMPGTSGTWAMTNQGTGLFDSGEVIKIQVFATNLSDAEALSLSQGTAATTAPYASYDFADGVGLVVADSEGSAHATVVKDPIWVVVPRDESDATKDVRGDELTFSTATTGPPNQRSLSMQLNMGI